MTAPAARGIIMQPESVAAMLSTPPTKTQTRRVAELSPEQARALDDGGQLEIGAGGLGGISTAVAGGVYTVPVRCPYGAPDDRLWVRERWCAINTCPMSCPRVTFEEGCAEHRRVVYLADGADKIAGYYKPETDDEPARWRPAMFMPRWASRLTLALVSIRLERLHAITEADAQAEGVPRPTCSHPDCSPGGCASSRFRPAYAVGWDRINGKRKGGAYAWARNPPVWAITFEVSP